MSGQHPYRQQPGQGQQPYRQQPGPQRPQQRPGQNPQQQPGPYRQQQPGPYRQQPPSSPRPAQPYRGQPDRVQPNPAQPTPVQPIPAPQHQSTYGVAPPLVQNVSLGGSTDRREPFGALVALGVFLLALSVVVPFLLFLLTANGPSGFEADPVWTLAVPAATAVLTFGFAARAVANGGTRRRPLRALVHLVLGCAVLVLAVSSTVDATGIQFVSY
ncbi:hypothetical protein [Serinibacter arcticus]|uniref:Uncharacterized protein n=1 Tax=Serinibacter arcticus TaxID=1655435 RepID=A0A4Z1DYI4_9MICO|nr:hypothetical protein [Serinibacter arcticus]TGO03979.1 hypothetical protein SERN_2570 [Serinibacter arcticus]